MYDYHVAECILEAARAITRATGALVNSATAAQKVRVKMCA